jgi:hypothetical protein
MHVVRGKMYYYIFMLAKSQMPWHLSPVVGNIQKIVPVSFVSYNLLKEDVKSLSTTQSAWDM